MMAQVGKLGRVLGLAVYAKSEVVLYHRRGSSSEKCKERAIFLENDKEGLIHARIGPASFTVEQLATLTAELKKLKPV